MRLGEALNPYPKRYLKPILTLNRYFELYEIKSVPCKPKEGTTKFRNFPQVLALCDKVLNLEPHNRYALSTKVYYLTDIGGEENIKTVHEVSFPTNLVTIFVTQL